jgi:hypothetical protein
MPATPEPNVCPLCGQPNQCAMEIERATGIPQESCWCTHVTFPPTLLNQIPDEARNKACVCAACAKKTADGSSNS